MKNHYSLWQKNIKPNIQIHLDIHPSVKMNSAFRCIQSKNPCKLAFLLNVAKINSNILSTIPVRYAGHSKWQNIRHIKAAKDQEKATLFTNLSKKLKLAVKEGGGTDPNTNYRLASTIDYCKKSSMPMTTIENAIKSCNNDKTKPQTSVMLEIKGPRNAMILVACLTSNKALTKQTLATFVRRSPVVKWLDSGSALSKFDVKGQIYTKPPPDMENPDDTTLDDGIEVGAEEVNKSEVEENHYEFITAPQDMMAVKTKLEKKKYEVVRAEIEYIPIELAVLDKDDLEKIAALYEKLESNPDVVQIYDNIECV
ncbi:hypothetical protein M8J75_015859 [Diaphorina citri]|nr:hypothetical protein M8J75_015859 [Diaphorina citri]